MNSLKQTKTSRNNLLNKSIQSNGSSAGSKDLVKTRETRTQIKRLGVMPTKKVYRTELERYREIQRRSHLLYGIHDF